MADKRAMYLASVVLSAISVCSLLDQKMGHPAYIMTNPVCDRTEAGLVGSPEDHPPSKSAST